MENDIEKIYVVHAISVDEITKEDHEKNFEIRKIKYPGWKTKTFEEYMDFEKGWGNDKWNIGSFDSSYHTSKEEAEEYVLKNIGDINEAGCYNYASVSPITLGYAYYNTETDPNEIEIFKWNKETHEYELITKDTENEEKYTRIMKYIWGFM